MAEKKSENFKSRYRLAIILILLLAVLLRFFRVDKRWSIFADSARDILVGREALKSGQLPLVGSFSSAGPFVFGPLFYWLISFSYLPNINLLIMPWIVIGIISVIFVWVMTLSGQKLWGEKGAIILGLLSAVSPAQIARSLNLTQHSLIGISAGLSLFAFISYFASGETGAPPRAPDSRPQKTAEQVRSISDRGGRHLKEQKSWFSFLMGLGLGFGLSMHYQALNLLPFALVVFLVPKNNFKKILKNLFLLILGILIPSLPLLIWDSLQGWANLKNILDYFFIGQYRIYVPNRWLTYIFQFWPQFWTSVSGGEIIVGWFFIVFTLGFFIYKLLTGRLSKITFWLGLIFLFQIVLLRYHRGEKFEGYLIYFHPLILFFSAWTLKNLWEKWRLPTMVLLLIIILTSLRVVLPEIQKSQSQAPILQEIVNQVKKRYPEKKFTLYDYQFASSAYSYGLAAFLDKESLIDPQKGIPIGICLYSCPSEFPLISDLYKPSKVVDLSSLPQTGLQKPSWYDVNPRIVFEEVTLWWKKEKLKSSFSLQKFLLEKLGFKN